VGATVSTVGRLGETIVVGISGVIVGDDVVGVFVGSHVELLSDLFLPFKDLHLLLLMLLPFL
jgi:hypothetical protein